MSTKPLVSVCVISYNSSKFILDTLESIKAQTYQNIELIVSDDKSLDNSIAICKDWIVKNKDRFIRTEIIVPEKNTGTSGNYNRGLFASKGEWIKFLDADDVLLPNCVEDNVEFINTNPEAKIVFSDELNFKDANNLGMNHFLSEKEKVFFNLDAHDQLMIAMIKNHIPPSSSFMNAEVLKANPYDERYRLLEDMPKWIDLLNKGYKFYYFDKVTAGYRTCESVTRAKKNYYSPLFVECVYNYLWNDLIKLIKLHNNEAAYNYQRKQMLKFELTFALLKNKKNFINDFFFVLIRAYCKFCVHYTLY